MEDLTQTLALTLGAGWASGINLYAAILVIGFMGATGRLELPEGLELLSDPLVMLAAGAMYVVEFFADKIPGVDTVWDTLHTFIRIPAGAMMAAGAVGDVGAGADLAAMLVGGGMAAGTHAAKAGTRALINTSPEPFSNWTASITEDLGVIGGLGMLWWIVNVLLPETLPEFGMAMVLRPSTLIIAFGAGVIAVAVAPVFTVRKMRRMDIPGTLRVMG